MRAADERRDFKTLLLADAEISSVLTPADVERAFDLAEQFTYVDHIFDRVFAATPDAGNAGPGEDV
jgi:adenylosuccinate lyase